MSADPNQIPQAAPYVAPTDGNPSIDTGVAVTPPVVPTTPPPTDGLAVAPNTPERGGAKAAFEDAEAKAAEELEAQFLADGGEVVGGALIVNQKRVGEYEFGKFVPNEVGKAYAKAALTADDEASLPPGTRTSTSSEYDPTEHEEVKPVAKAAVEKVAATNAAIAEANTLTDEQRASQAAQDAVVAQGVRSAQKGAKKGAAPESTNADSTGPASA